MKTKDQMIILIPSFILRCVAGPPDVTGRRLVFEGQCLVPSKFRRTDSRPIPSRLVPLNFWEGRSRPVKNEKNTRSILTGRGTPLAVQRRWENEQGVDTKRFFLLPMWSGVANSDLLVPNPSLPTPTSLSLQKDSLFKIRLFRERYEVSQVLKRISFLKETSV